MKLYLAPLQGMTVAHYRHFYDAIFGGMDAYYAPFIATTDIRKSSPKLFKDLLPEQNNPDLHVVPQLLGNNGTNFRDFAKEIVAMGYSEINWNIGCPFPTVTKKKKGSGILPYANIIRTFLDEVCRDLSYDLTVKMRLGYSDLEEGFEVMDVLNAFPIKNVIIHGRTGIQKYEGTVDLKAFNDLYAACKHPVTYNGDIYTLEDFIKISTRFPGIDTFMIGRGALRDPFLPAAIKGITYSSDQKRTKLRQFHNAVFEHYKSTLSGDKHVCDKMKEFWSYLAINIDSADKTLKKMRKCRTVSAYTDVVQHIFETPGIWHL